MYVMHTVLLSTPSRWLHTSPITPSPTSSQLTQMPSFACL